MRISTVDVYGHSPGSLDETKPYVMTGREYGDSKIEAEKVCREAIARGAPITLLRSTLVHGPFSATWTVEFAERLQVQPWRLAESDCQGTCNLVYVDDLVETLLGTWLSDVVRAMDPHNATLFTWWAPWRNLRARNIGWRLDYLLASPGMATRAQSCVVQTDVGTSDHAPVVMTTI